MLQLYVQSAQQSLCDIVRACLKIFDCHCELVLALHHVVEPRMEGLRLVFSRVCPVDMHHYIADTGTQGYRVDGGTNCEVLKYMSLHLRKLWWVVKENNATQSLE